MEGGAFGSEGDPRAGRLRLYEKVPTVLPTVREPTNKQQKFQLLERRANCWFGGEATRVVLLYQKGF